MGLLRPVGFTGFIFGMVIRLLRPPKAVLAAGLTEMAVAGRFLEFAGIGTPPI